MPRMERKKTGRPSKGDRHKFGVRVPLDLADAVAKRASELGMSINDYIGNLVSQDTGVPYSQQEAIPTSAA